MKIFLSTRALFFGIVLLFASSIFGQQKGILLEHRENKRTVFIEENKRIKIKITDGTSFVGNFNIVDDQTISINDEAIPLASIVKIKERSLGVAILRNASIVIGSYFILVGSLVYAALGDPMLFAIVGGIGVPFFVTPLLADRHDNRDWNYKISTLPPDPLVTGSK